MFELDGKESTVVNLCLLINKLMGQNQAISEKYIVVEKETKKFKEANNIMLIENENLKRELRDKELKIEDLKFRIPYKEKKDETV